MTMSRRPRIGRTARRLTGSEALQAALLAIAAIAGLPAAPAVAQAPPLGYVQEPPPDAYLPLWQGAYAGFHLGYGDADAADGFLGGLQIGYVWQSGWIVYGLEADVTWADIGYSDTFRACSAASGCVSTRVEASIDWLATVRGRLGFLLQPGLLPYATAGVGFVSGSSSASIDVPGFDIDPLHSDDTSTDFVYGIGLESRIGPTTLLRIEYLRFDDTELDVVRAGLNFKLGN